MSRYDTTKKQVSVVVVGVLLVGVIALGAMSMGAFAQQDGSTANHTLSEENRSSAVPIQVGEYVDPGNYTNRGGSVNDSEHVYRFNTTAGIAINVRTSGSVGNTSLYGPDGALLQAQDVGPLDTWTSGGVAETTGTYYVGIEPGGANSIGTGGYYVSTVVTATPDSFEPNDDRDNATPLEAGERTSGNLTKGEADWFAIDAGAGQRVEATLTVPQDTDPGQNARLDLFGPDGERLDVGEDNATDYNGASADSANIEGQNATAEQGGTYYVRLTGVENLGGFIQYDLTANVSGDATTTTTTEEPATTETTGVTTMTEQTDTAAGDTATEDNTTERTTTEETTTTGERSGSDDGTATQPSDDDAANGGNGKSKMGSDGGDATEGANGKAKGT